MEAVHVRGDTASYRADLRCEGRDIVDFGMGAQSRLADAQPPCCLRRRHTENAGLEEKARGN